MLTTEVLDIAESLCWIQDTPWLSAREVLSTNSWADGVSGKDLIAREELDELL